MTIVHVHVLYLKSKYYRRWRTKKNLGSHKPTTSIINQLPEVEAKKSAEPSFIIVQTCYSQKLKKRHGRQGWGKLGGGNPEFVPPSNFPSIWSKHYDQRREKKNTNKVEPCFLTSQQIRACLLFDSHQDWWWTCWCYTSTNYKDLPHPETTHRPGSRLGKPPRKQTETEKEKPCDWLGIGGGGQRWSCCMAQIELEWWRRPVRSLQ